MIENGGGTKRGRNGGKSGMRARGKEVKGWRPRKGGGKMVCKGPLWSGRGGEDCKACKGFGTVPLEKRLVSPAGNGNKRLHTCYNVLFPFLT